MRTVTDIGAWRLFARILNPLYGATDYMNRQKNQCAKNAKEKGKYAGSYPDDLEQFVSGSWGNGKDEEAVQVYIHQQEAEDRRLDQMNLL